jgi:Zn-dependent M28 family amino/carboxypeptidase
MRFATVCMFAFETTMLPGHEISVRRAGSAPNRRPRFLAWQVIALAAAALSLAPETCAQIAPLQPPSQWQVPNGAGACSVEKSCTDLAPGMIQSAWGPSPLEENLRYLMRAASAPENSTRGAKMAEWAVAALRKAGVDEVRTEKSTIPEAPAHARTKRSSGGAELENVVAEIHGREKPNEYVLLGADLDAPGSGKGLADDVCAAAVVIDAARVIHASGNIPRRSIRFILFANQRHGRTGPLAYVQMHRPELDRVIAGVIFEGGAGRINGYSLAGREDALKAVREALQPLASLGVKNFTTGATADSDRFPFLLEGVPTLVPTQGMSDAVLNDQTAAGTLDKADSTELKRQAAIAAITAYALADDLERVAPRQSRAEVQQLLEQTGLEQQMKAEGTWAAWNSGRWP